MLVICEPFPLPVQEERPSRLWRNLLQRNVALPFMVRSDGTGPRVEQDAEMVARMFSAYGHGFTWRGHYKKHECVAACIWRAILPVYDQIMDLPVDM